MQCYLHLIYSTVGAGVRGCRLIRKEMRNYIHHGNRCVHVIPVSGSELPSGSMVGVTQHHFLYGTSLCIIKGNRVRCITSSHVTVTACVVMRLYCIPCRGVESILCEVAV